MIHIPSVQCDVEGGISGSPPAILDSWLQLQHALTLESVDNGKTLVAYQLVFLGFYRPRNSVCLSWRQCLQSLRNMIVFVKKVSSDSCTFI